LYANNQDQVNDFAARILWLLDHPEARKTMGAFGRERVERELSWEHSVGNLLAAYRRAFSKRAHWSSPILEDN
jgi:glycosyltransferase involved in cell wall biosynthesis